MKHIEELKEQLCRELDSLAEKGVSASNVMMIDTLLHSLKNLDKVMESEYSQSGGSSYGRGRSSYDGGSAYDSYRGGSSYGDSMYNGSSYARGRGRYAHRDSMGRYASAGGKEEMISKLEEMMEGAQSTREKEAIRSCLSQLENG